MFGRWGCKVLTDGSADLPAKGTVENLLETVEENLLTCASSFGIWVPLVLTWRGQPVEWNVASTAIQELMFTKGFSASRQVEDDTGRFCIFDRE